MKYIAPWEFKDKYLRLKSKDEIITFVNKVLYVMLSPIFIEDMGLINYLYTLDDVLIYFDIFTNINVVSYTMCENPKYIKLEDINFTDKVVIKRRNEIINYLNKNCNNE